MKGNPNADYPRLIPKGDPKGRMHGFQLWGNLPSSLKMTPPRYQEVKARFVTFTRRQSTSRLPYRDSNGSITSRPAGDEEAKGVPTVTDKLRGEGL